MNGGIKSKSILFSGYKDVQLVTTLDMIHSKNLSLKSIFFLKGWGGGGYYLNPFYSTVQRINVIGFFPFTYRI